MIENIHKQTRGVIKHWYLPLILGLLFITIGIWVISTPLETYLSLAMLFTIMFFLTGILEIIYAIANRKELDRWAWSLAIGIVDLIVGILLISTPGLTAIILPFYIGFAIMFRSIMAMRWAMEIKKIWDFGLGKSYGAGDPWTPVLFLFVIESNFCWDNPSHMDCFGIYIHRNVSNRFFDQIEEAAYIV